MEEKTLQKAERIVVSCGTNDKHVENALNLESGESLWIRSQDQQIHIFLCLQQLADKPSACRFITEYKQAQTNARKIACSDMFWSGSPYALFRVRRRVFFN